MNLPAPPNPSELKHSAGLLLQIKNLTIFLINFSQVHYSDFPKGNHGDYLTLATLTTEPPQLCHGAGFTLEASHDEAAIKALQILTELGLDNVKPIKINPDDKKPKPILSNGLKK